jgi:hypothetical protein
VTVPRLAAAVAVVLTVAGCSSGSSTSSGSGATSSQTGAPCPTAAYPTPASDRPRYSLDVRVDPAAHLVSGSVDVRFTPDIATDRLVLRLWANGPVLRHEGARMSVGDITVDGGAARPSRPDPTTVVLRGRHAAGAAVRLHVAFRLTLPQKAKDRISQNGDSIRLGSFFPILPWEPGRGWALEPPTLANGETSSSPTADFDATVHVPAGLDVVAGGEQTGADTWRAVDVRDFGVATGRFTYLHRVVHAPDPVRLTIAVSPGVPVKAADAADEAQAAIEHMARVFGAYPWRTLTLAYGPDLVEEGIEYPTILFEGPDSHHVITAHEVAHQWFYSLVGNDQARDPWLDEGFASWAGAQTSGVLGVFTGVRPPPAAAGHMGAPMTYWSRHPRDYFAGVYAQPVQALQSIGPTRQVECALRRYVAANAYGIATSDEAVTAFASEFPDARSYFATYGVR